MRDERKRERERGRNKHMDRQGARGAGSKKRKNREWNRRVASLWKVKKGCFSWDICDPAGNWQHRAIWGASVYQDLISCGFFFFSPFNQALYRSQRRVKPCVAGLSIEHSEKQCSKENGPCSKKLGASRCRTLTNLSSATYQLCDLGWFMWLFWACFPICKMGLVRPIC